MTILRDGVKKIDLTSIFEVKNKRICAFRGGICRYLVRKCSFDRSDVAQRTAKAFRGGGTDSPSPVCSYRDVNLKTMAEEDVGGARKRKRVWQCRQQKTFVLPRRGWLHDPATIVLRGRSPRLGPGASCALRRRGPVLCPRYPVSTIIYPHYHSKKRWFQRLQINHCL